MKHCAQCNLDFPASYRFCGSCGEGLSESIACDACGEIVESKWKFCTGCGKALAPPEPSSEPVSGAVSPAAPTPDRELDPLPVAKAEFAESVAREWYAAPELLEESETTAASARARQMLLTGPPNSEPELPAPIVSAGSRVKNSGNGKSVPALTMLSAYGRPATVVTSESGRRYPILLTLVLIVFCAALGFGGWYLVSRGTFAASTSPPQQAAAALTNEMPAPSAGETPIKRAITANSVDDDWRRLRQERISAQPSERATIVSSLQVAEDKYSSDYRFPYERAKLSIKGITSHHDAFTALATAAEKAIDSGKAQEMLDNLQADKDGDFYKLARGHHEWHALIEALENKDKSKLVSPD